MMPQPKAEYSKLRVVSPHLASNEWPALPTLPPIGSSSGEPTPCTASTILTSQYPTRDSNPQHHGLSCRVVCQLPSRTSDKVFWLTLHTGYLSPAKCGNRESNPDPELGKLG